MGDEILTNPQGEKAANPGQGADEFSTSGSQFKEGDLVRVEHPDFDQADDAAVKADGEAAGQARDGAAMGESDERETGDQAGSEQNREGDSGSEEGKPVATLTYRGQQVPIKSREQLIELASKGLDYTAKTQMAAPYVHLAQAMNVLEAKDPQKAQQVIDILSGREQSGAQKAQNANQAEQFFITDENGQKLPVDNTFIQALDTVLQARGLTPEALQQQLNQQQDPNQAAASQYMSRLVTKEQVNEVSSYVKNTFGRDDFMQAIPMIQQEMAQAGITQGDPRDNPTTWIQAYQNLALSGRLPQTKMAKPESKRGLKQKAQSGKFSDAEAKAEAWQQASRQALKSGENQDFVRAVGARISHPDFEKE
ncbi:hypothetical protein [Dethiosulfatarculus sandiegensis]|uniref:Uncharacterized protein n=1 Tax=Dethiosulfatarculus sandiegensis TaxID=1429043 RepID=A0A0D2JWQ8_9BACT|nr:hypothetical protein [Dethiosulfatarculus sandiegensis]KIX13995.1 hypothetical protein X474_13000 [Dethiosulfatarculus sandiegensis]